MARRSEFKGIVRNFAHMLNNRNNDHLGYWATGQRTETEHLFYINQSVRNRA